MQGMQRPLSSSLCHLGPGAARRQYEDEGEPPRPRTAVRIAALVPPALILLGLLAHTVLEGLAIGLQVGAE